MAQHGTRRRCLWFSLMVVLVMVGGTIAWRTYIPDLPITLNNDNLSKYIEVLENTESDDNLSIALLGESRAQFRKLVAQGGTTLADECIQTLLSENWGGDLARRAQLVLAQTELTDRQAELLSARANENKCIWPYLQLRETQEDKLSREFSGVRVEYLPDLIRAFHLHEIDLESYFGKFEHMKFEHIQNLEVLDLDGDDKNEVVVRSSLYGANYGRCFARIFSPDLNDVAEFVGGNAFHVRILLLQQSYGGEVIIAVPDFYREMVTIGRYAGTIALRYELFTYSQGAAEKIGEVYVPAW